MRFFRDLVLALLFSSAVLLMLEGGLRVAGVYYDASLYQPDPDRGYSLRPNATGWNVSENECYVRINSDGMRDHERPISRPPDTLRIAVIGSSEAEARQVPLEKTFEAVVNRRLERTLGPHGRHVDLMNFAVPGYTFSQEYLTLHNHVWKYDPQIVLLSLSVFTVLKNTRELYPGDPKGTPFYVLQGGRLVPDPLTRAARPLDARRLYWKNLSSDWMNRSALLSLVNQARVELEKQQQTLLARLKRKPNVPAASTVPPDYMSYWTYLPDLAATQPAWAIGEAFLEAMQKDCSEHGAEFWIVIADEVMQTHPSLAERARFIREKHLPSLAAGDERIERFADAHGIPVIPLAPPLGEYAASHGIALHGFAHTPFNDGHWNELGHELAGNVIADQLLNRSTVVRQWGASVRESLASQRGR
jgi:hypothetical protein